MHDERSAILAQVPLTVSPFITLPKTPTLPHNYTSLPSTLPPSILSTSSLASTSSNSSGSNSNSNSNNGNDQALRAYVTTSSGHAAHPTQIIAQNKTLLFQLRNGATDAETKVRGWEEGIRERELREKRRKAPGWLDREEKILEPERERSRDESALVESQRGTERGGAGGHVGARDLLGDDDGDESGVKKSVGAGEDGGDLGALMDRAFGQPSG